MRSPCMHCVGVWMCMCAFQIRSESLRTRTELGQQLTGIMDHIQQVHETLGAVQSSLGDVRTTQEDHGTRLTQITAVQEQIAAGQVGAAHQAIMTAGFADTREAISQVCACVRVCVRTSHSSARCACAIRSCRDYNGLQLVCAFVHVHRACVCIRMRHCVRVSAAVTFLRHSQPLHLHQCTTTILTDNDVTKRKIDDVHTSVMNQFVRLRADVAKLARRDGESDEAVADPVPVPAEPPIAFDVGSFNLTR